MIEVVDMELRSDAQPKDEGGQDIGEPFQVNLAIRADTSSPIEFAVVQAILRWTPGLEVVDPLGGELGPYRDWTKMQDGREHFFDDRHIGGLNDDMYDGELRYVAMANFNNYPKATQTGLLIHCWKFTPTRAGYHRVSLKMGGANARSYVMSAKYPGRQIQRQPLVRIYSQSEDPRHRR